MLSKKLYIDLKNIIGTYFYEYILIFIIYCTILFYIYNINFSFWGDEFFSILKTSSDKTFINIIKDASLSDTWPPLYYILLHYIQTFFGNSNLSLRILSIVSSIFSNIVLYIFAKELYSKKEAILSCIFFAFSYFILTYGLEVRGFSLYLLFTILSFYCLLLVIKKRKNKYLFLYFIFSIMASLTNYFALIIIIFQLTYILLEQGFIIKKNYISFILFICLISIYPIIHLAHIYDTILKLYFLSYNDTNFIIKHLLPSLSLNISIIRPEIYIICLSLFFYFLFIKDKSNQFVLFFILTPILFTNILAFYSYSLLQVRYFIFVFPLVYIMVSHFIVKISRKFFYIVLILILFLYCFNINKIKVHKISNDDKDTVLLLNNFSKDKILVLHSKLYLIQFYLKNLNIMEYPIDEHNINLTEIEYFVNMYKYVFFIYPFMQEQEKYNYLFEREFKMIEISPKLYYLSKK